MIKLFKPSIRRQRLTTCLAYFLVGALVTILAAPLQAADASAPSGGLPGQTFSILLSGPYRPVLQGPDLGLSQVDLSDGSFSRTKIFSVNGLPENDEHRQQGNSESRSGDRDKEKAIGKFYVQFAGSLAAYDLPGGALTMVFTGSNVSTVPDGAGGNYTVGTFDLDILEATGRYQAFLGGHNKMVDILHQLADGTFVEHCICVISRPA